MRLFRSVLVILFLVASATIPYQILNGKIRIPAFNNESSFIESVYNDLDLAGRGLDFEIFKTTLQGYQKLLHDNKLGTSGIVTIADLSQPSVRKRLYIIDLSSKKLLFQTFVSHGKNSGELFARQFSNTPSSLQSSLGFYITGEVYTGKHGISLKLHGQEPGFNDQALDRAIVVHGADYVSENFIHNTGRLGRSFGCPAVASELAEPIISTIRDGSCLFVYSPDPVYLKRSLLASNFIE
jgi:L,D-transpeptidase catalytic domain